MNCGHDLVGKLVGQPGYAPVILGHSFHKVWAKDSVAWPAWFALGVDDLPPFKWKNTAFTCNLSRWVELG